MSAILPSEASQVLSTSLRDVAVPLSRGLVAIVSACDAQIVGEHRWHAKPGRQGAFYAATRIGGRLVYMHRLVLGVHAQAGHSFVDHIDFDGLNNRRENLRLCSAGDNVRRARVKLRPGLSRGVYRQKNRYIARISFAGKYLYLGSFVREADAAGAYRRAAETFFGAFAPALER